MIGAEIPDVQGKDRRGGSILGNVKAEKIYGLSAESVDVEGNQLWDNVDTEIRNPVELESRADPEVPTSDVYDLADIVFAY